MLVQRVLQRLGYRVLVVTRSAESVGVAAAHDGRVDLLVTDVVMPEVNGREVADRLLVIRPTMRVLYMSGYPDGDARHDAFVVEDGAGFIQKPFTAEALAQKVREVLDAPAPGRDALGAARPVIAIVDDVATNRLLLRGLLSRRYEIAEYDSGAAALEAFAQSAPDAVLLDIAMPGLDGVEVVHRMRTDRRLADVPVIAMTGHEMPGDRARFLETGFTKFITKPVMDERKLFDVLDSCLVERPI